MTGARSPAGHVVGLVGLVLRPAAAGARAVGTAALEPRSREGRTPGRAAERARLAGHSEPGGAFGAVSAFPGPTCSLLGFPRVLGTTVATGGHTTQRHAHSLAGMP